MSRDDGRTAHSYSKTDQLRRPTTSTPRSFRKVATTAEWRVLHAAKHGPCVICGHSGRNSLHHIVPRSLGGDDTFDNLLSLCGSGTTGCHGLVEARDPGALQNLAVRLTDSEYAYCIEKLGEGAMGRLFGVMVADGTPPSSARLPNPALAGCLVAADPHGQPGMPPAQDFAERFGADQAAAIIAAAHQHMHDNFGSDELRWALLIAVGFECVSKPRYAASHGITADWAEVDAWMRSHADWFGEHDGDVDYVSLYCGVYNDYVPAGASS